MSKPTTTLEMIEDLKNRLDARKRGETTGYGELHSLANALTCYAYPALEELKVLKSAETLDAKELGELDDLQKLIQRARIVCGKG